MNTYKLLSAEGSWILTRPATGERVAHYQDREEALHESIRIAHREGASLILDTQAPRPVRRTVAGVLQD